MNVLEPTIAVRTDCFLVLQRIVDSFQKEKFYILTSKYGQHVMQAWCARIPALKTLHSGTSSNFRRVSMNLLYLIFQEAGRRIIFMCYITLKTPSIQTSWLMYHGFIAEGVFVNNGKHISVTTLDYPSSHL